MIAREVSLLIMYNLQIEMSLKYYIILYDKQNVFENMNSMCLVVCMMYVRVIQMS